MSYLQINVHTFVIFCVYIHISTFSNQRILEKYFIQNQADDCDSINTIKLYLSFFACFAHFLIIDL